MTKSFIELTDLNNEKIIVSTKKILYIKSISNNKLTYSEITLNVLNQLETFHKIHVKENLEKIRELIG